ncbi:hypothetical protein F5Y03DRAFT_406827 [Xylaria venustula]|nr:hypothetical protein F5Y03DRAFT_406827 [Xylaria venustula]
MTVQSHYRISTWRPYDLIPQVAPTPVMILTPTGDRMSLPRAQKVLFDTLKMPKEHLLVPGRGHMDVFTSETFGTIMSEQVVYTLVGVRVLLEISQLAGLSFDTQ